MKHIDRNIIRRFITWLFVFAVPVILVVFIVSSQLFFDVGIVCVFKGLFGWECPGCGGTRMAVSILHGEFYQAFRYNAFVFTTFPILLIVFIKQSYMYIVHNKLIDWLDKFLVGYAAGLLIFGIIRNIPMFSWLAPTTL